MNIKVFKTNALGNIELTRAELEKVLNEIYNEGYAAGEKHQKESYWTWTAPCVTNTQVPVIRYGETNCNNLNSTNSAAKTNEQKIAPISNKTEAKPQTYTVNVGDLSKAIDTIFNKPFYADSIPEDAISKLAKELNF